VSLEPLVLDETSPGVFSLLLSDQIGHVPLYLYA